MISTPNKSGGPLAAGTDTASVTDPYILTLCAWLDRSPYGHPGHRSSNHLPSSRVVPVRPMAVNGCFCIWDISPRRNGPEMGETLARSIPPCDRHACARRAFTAAGLGCTDVGACNENGFTRHPSHHAPESDNALTDTQVFGILETRRVEPVGEVMTEQKGAEISLLRPEDPELVACSRKPW